MTNLMLFDSLNKKTNSLIMSVSSSPSSIPTFLDGCKQCFFLIWSQISLQFHKCQRNHFLKMSYSQHLLHCCFVLIRLTTHFLLAISPDISTVSHNWAVLSSMDHLRLFYSLECRVVQLKLVTSGRGCSHAMVGPECTESVSHERKQLLVVPQTLTAGQDGAGVHLQEKYHQNRHRI